MAVGMLVIVPVVTVRPRPALLVTGWRARAVKGRTARDADGTKRRLTKKAREARDL